MVSRIWRNASERGFEVEYLQSMLVKGVVAEMMPTALSVHVLIRVVRPWRSGEGHTRVTHKPSTVGVEVLLPSRF